MTYLRRRPRPAPAPIVAPVRPLAQVCAEKRRYPDESTARAAALHAIETYGNTPKLYPYRCSECRGWHLTRFPNRNTAAVVAGNPIHEGA